ncbi:2-phosphoxylose phosphatase 1 [Sergentomyia squamirostris]
MALKFFFGGFRRYRERNLLTAALKEDIVRLSRQHRTIYCYLILSIWIFLLIAGMYRYMGTTLHVQNYASGRNFFFGDSQGRQGRRQIQECNNLSLIASDGEGGNLEGWNLAGVLMLIRHGDRGPMEHIRGINTINCGFSEPLPILHRYKNFIINSTVSVSASFSHSVWLKNGPFHGFPLLPPLEKVCLLGQLTYRGLAQHLKIGEIVRNAYAPSLGLLQRPQPLPPLKVLNGTSLDGKSPGIPPETEVVVYSTRYRRTFQSAMALLYALLPLERWMGLTIRESHSLSFCFTDCACQQADQLKNEAAREDTSLLHQHPAIAAVVHWIGLSLLQNPSGQANPLEVRDAVLALLCHEAPLPCRKAKDKSARNPPVHPTTPENPDVINIDSEDGQTSAKEDNEIEDIDPEIEPEGCIEEPHIDALISFTNWQATKKTKSPYTRKIGLLRAYGLIRNIVGNMLKMISGERIKFVLYSGHDRTLQYLLAALGLHAQPFFIPYAARMAFEVYRSQNEAQFYFRVVYNGKDVTNRISFCEGRRSLRVSRGARREKADLCPIENIIRFIHDDYFVTLNATNFKDACTVHHRNYDF